MNKNGKKKILIGSLVVPLGVGIVSALLTSDAMKQFHFFRKPPFSPPGSLFPIVWTILYIMMGLAFFFMLTSDADRDIKKKAILFYGIQLGMNFCWSLFFFNASEYFAAFIWLLAMLAVVFTATLYFFKADKRAGGLMIPYIVWICFAGYLNFGIWILSRTPAIMPR